MKALLIFDMSPEELSLYVIDNPSPEELSTLNAANGKWVDTEAVNEVMDFICKVDDHCQTPGKPSNCKWSVCKVEPENGKGIQEKVDVVYCCGFIL